MKDVLMESEINEAERAKRAASCSQSRMKDMSARHERERSSEVLKITRLREEHAALLAEAMRNGAPEHNPFGRRGAFRVPGAGVPGLYADKVVPDKPGTTAQDLNFLKHVYSKLEGAGGSSRAVGRPSNRNGGSASSSARSSAGGTVRATADRATLLAQRAALVERIAALERAELGGGGFGSSRSSARGGFGLATARSGSMTARSTTSTASGASFLSDVDAPPRWKSRHPTSVPHLQMPGK